MSFMRRQAADFIAKRNAQRLEMGVKVRAIEIVEEQWAFIPNDFGIDGASTSVGRVGPPLPRANRLANIISQ